jgi:alpha-tubulin suppressor-like RCC1 family protein
VSCGSTHTLALTVVGHVYAWGKGEQGQLGLGVQRTSAKTPTHLSILPCIVAVSAGNKVSAALARTADLYTWGLGVCLGVGAEEEGGGGGGGGPR